MKLFSERFDDAFKKLDFTDELPEEYYVHFEDTMPWVGCDYGDGKHKKLLLICESRYLPDKANDYFRTPHGWYTHDWEQNSDLDDLSVAWTSIRGTMNGHEWSRTYDNINSAMANVAGQDRQENMFRYVAFYNYFLRPAPKRGSLKGVHEVG